MTGGSRVGERSLFGQNLSSRLDGPACLSSVPGITSCQCHLLCHLCVVNFSAKSCQKYSKKNLIFFVSVYHGARPAPANELGLTHNEQ